VVEAGPLTVSKDMRKQEVASPFRGRWQIVSMTAWDQDFINAEVPAFIDFQDDDLGERHFAFVRGDVDYRVTERESQPTVEFTWEGLAGSVQVLGRGWAVLSGDELHGMIFLHLSDESGFVAKRAKAQQRRQRKRTEIVTG
jgi:hypothetical protein